MPLSINLLRDQEQQEDGMGNQWHELDRDVYLDNDGKPVPKGSTKAAQLLGRKGQSIPKKDAERLGLAGGSKQGGRKSQNKDATQGGKSEDKGGS